jgi:hypothetical protein
MAKATTVRFSDEIFARLDQASSRTGLPVNSIVVAACLEWMDRHTPFPGSVVVPAPNLSVLAPAPRWSTIRRAVVEAVAGRSPATLYPFERFSQKAQGMLTAAQAEATKSGFNYIGTEHLMLAAFADSTSNAARVLASMGVREHSVRTALARKLATAKAAKPRPSSVMPTSRVKKVIELAFKLSGSAGDPNVNTGHILLALVSEGEGIAAHVMKDEGVTAARVESAMDDLTEPET